MFFSIYIWTDKVLEEEHNNKEEEMLSYNKEKLQRYQR